MAKIRIAERYRLFWAFALIAVCGGRAQADDSWVVYRGGDGPGKGTRVVLVSGDEEYRSEEALPQLAKILATRHGFTCTVLFAIGDDGTIDPKRLDNIPGLEALDTADLLIIATRFRDLPDDQMKHVVDYLESGRPIIGLRTATHAFDFKKNKTYAKYTWNGKVPGFEGGFGRLIFGETWHSHHGAHGSQSTRGILAPGEQNHPILKGIKDGQIWGPTDVYGVRLPLPGDSKPLVFGQILSGMKPDDSPITGSKNDPMMPVAWTKSYSGAHGKTGRVFATTMGASQDLENEGVRRLLVNATYWATGLESKLSADADVSIVGEYHPLPFGFGKFKTGVKPSSLELK
ncbi:Trehalose utilisation [Singulisphaera sp. GP187]|uniref:ThuA domain-containing protein n=1 Tax=Singulisphaera sp. GP187 TaxID=1882752 RepID=UPI000927170D|nr:ThuA domain-containing protein [Singulisphaera sp. GP187]SIO25071.1 Trehalose utilisation [Singulisphaera sp. GP187]